LNLLPKKKRLPVALLATRSIGAIRAVPLDHFQTREAVSTFGVESAFHADPVLAVVDLPDLVECEEVSRPVIGAALDSMRSKGVVVVDSMQFLAEPERWVGEALMAGGLRTGIRQLPSRVALVTNYCGGVGKTTLSLALARQFRKISGLSAAVVEVGVGGSSLEARLGEHTSLYNAITQNQPAQDWEGVSMFPSNGWEAETLAADDRLPSFLDGIVRGHTLTVLDAFPSNPLWKYALELATDVIVVATPRPDSVAQTEAILRRLKEETGTLEPQPRIHLVLNQVKTVGERLALTGQLSAWVGFDERRAERLDGSLAESLLEILYHNWSQQKVKKNGRNGSGHGRKRPALSVVKKGGKKDRRPRRAKAKKG
jgi:hypothetical protein